MPFARATLAELVERTRSDFRGRLGIGGALLRRAMADVLAVVWAGGIYLLYGFLVWMSKQLFADTAEREALLRQASMYGITPTAATFATGTVTATGTDGNTIPAGTILVRDDGVTYSVTADATIASGTVTVSVEAVQAGEGGNLGAGELLSLESPIPGVDSTLTVVVIEDGVDEEGTEGTRARLLLRKREPPEGGADQDYKAWTLSVAGVTRAWVYRYENGLGTVVVRFVMDGEDDIFPNPTAVAAVQAKLDSERPTTAEVTAAAPTPMSVDFDVTITPNTTAVHDAVTAELEALFARVSEPGDGAGRGRVKLSQLLVAIGTSEGVTDFTLNSPSADVVPSTGALPIVGTFAWS